MKSMKVELEAKGFTVLPNVLTEEECNRCVEEFQEWLGKFGDGFPEHWHSLIHKYRIGHAAAAWRIRLKTKPVFSSLWGTDKLLTSVDGVAMGSPPEEGKTNFFSGRYKFHHDQSSQKLGSHAYQGAVYLEEAAEDDWCLAVLEKSHLHFQEFNQRFSVPYLEEGGDEFREVAEEELDWLTDIKGCRITRVAVPKGGMVLWDSRTVHAGGPPHRGRENPGRWRFVTFVCMGPALWATHRDMQVKREAYREMKVTAHWPSHSTRIFTEFYDTENFQKSEYDFTEMPAVAKTDGARLIGGDKMYDFNDGQPNGPHMPSYIL